MNYAYNNNFSNPYARPFGVPNYAQPQYQMANQMPMQQQQMAQMQSQPQMQQQPMQQPVQQTMPIDMPIQSVVFATLKEAEAYILMPNTKGLFIDKTNGMIYEKVCGADGQSFISHYKKVENNENKSVAEEKAVNLPEFATKTDLKGFVSIEQYEKTMQALECLKGQINGLKTMLETKAEQPKKIKTENKTNKESE